MFHVLKAPLYILLLAAPVAATVIGEPKKPYADRADDVPRSRSEEITQSAHEYRIFFSGTVDGFMTRSPIGYSAFVQGWQPNRSVLIENIGDADVRNPWLVVNGRGHWQSLDSVVAEATRGYQSDADRARALWEFIRRQRFHACTWDNECSDAMKALNVYGYTLCGNQALVLNDLWKAAGLATRRCYPIGHVVGEVFYDGRYHLLDSDEHVICLLRDNQTIASEEEIVRDHDLVKRTHTYGIGSPENRRTDEFSASLYVYEGKRGAEFARAAHHRMELVLRPGESIEFRWDHLGKQYTAGLPLQPGQPRRDGLGDLLAGWGPTAYDNMRNGKLRYRPRLSGEALGGAEQSHNVAWDAEAGCLRPRDAAEPAQVTWQFASPYILVGGCAAAAVELQGGASAEWRHSTDGTTWAVLSTLPAGGRPGKLVASLDAVVSPRGKPTYRHWLQLLLRGQAAARDVSFEHDIQTSALGLPELSVGENRVVYTDASPGSRRVRVTHRWLERTAWHAPQAPAEALAPRDGAAVEGTQVRFAWSEATDPDGDTIADYHFELSAHADMRWPLSPTFEKRTSLTPSRGKPEWTVPYVGLLNPDTTYYWRVRAMDEHGVWGPWSRTFRFHANAPGVPLDVRLVPDGDRSMMLTWRPNPQGRRPVAYKVHGSDEKGFSASEAEHLVFRGKGFVRTMEEYATKPADAPDAGTVRTPPTLVGRTAELRLQVVGPDVALPNTNAAFYRVVAVDEKGNESGPSDYAEVPRPFVCSRAPSPAKAGAAYRYEPRVIRSLGDLRCRRSEASSYNAAFWDREELTFRAVQLPEGFSLDAHTGRIEGTPRSAGNYEMVFEVSTAGKSATVTERLEIRE